MTVRMSPLTQVRSVLVLADCGHWWRESQAKGLVVTDGPRVCASCPLGCGASVGVSPQGLPLVPVTYLTDWTELEIVAPVAPGKCGDPHDCRCPHGCDIP